MLKRVEIHNFRSCKDVVLDNLDGFTALVGKNASGKTNVLKAIEWAANSAQLLNNDLFADSKGCVALEFDLYGRLFRYEIELLPTEKGIESRVIESLVLKSELAGEILVERNGNTLMLPRSGEHFQINLTSTALPTLNAILSPEHEFVKTVSEVLSFLGSIRYYPLDEPNDTRERYAFVLEGNYDDDEKRMLGQFSAPSNSVMAQLLHLHHYRKDRFDELVSLLGAAGLGIIDDISVNRIEMPNTDKRMDFVFFKTNSTKRALSFHELSLGTRRIIRALTSLFVDDTSVFLLEHPEDGIHRGLLQKLIGILLAYAEPSQFIVATHSATVINRLDPPQVRLISMRDGVTQARMLSANEVAATTKYLEEDGTLAEALETMQEI